MAEDERDLVRRAAAGDERAFEGLVSGRQRLAGALAFGVLGDLDLARDAVQEALVKVHRGLPSLRDPDGFGAWFVRVVRNTARDLYRRREARPVEALASGAGEGPLEDPAARPPEVLGRKEIADRVRGAVAGLSSEYREVVALKYLDGLSYGEIAESLGVSVSAVESRLFRARNLLRDRLKGVSVP